jgi:CHAD domain-containing protein
MQFAKMFQEKVALAVKLYAQLCGEYDVEVLHKFRVTLRKMYAYNSLFIKKIDKAKSKEFKKLLQQLIKPTSLLRDIDLFLLEIEHLLIQPHTKQFLRDEFLAVQNREKEIILAQSYRKKLEGLQTYIQAFEHSSWEMSDLGIYAVLSDFQKKLLKKFLKIGNETPALELHELRKEFKKLRYSLDCYNEQCKIEGREIESFFNLKTLQDLFGVIQDNYTREQLIASVKIGKDEKSAMRHYFHLLGENAKQQLFVLAK